MKKSTTLKSSPTKTNNQRARGKISGGVSLNTSTSDGLESASSKALAPQLPVTHKDGSSLSRTNASPMSAYLQNKPTIDTEKSSKFGKGVAPLTSKGVATSSLKSVSNTTKSSTKNSTNDPVIKTTSSRSTEPKMAKKQTIKSSTPPQPIKSIAKPSTAKIVTKPITSQETRQKITFKDIPSDVIILILDYYGGMFKKSTLVEKDGKTDYSKFIKRWYGRFLDKSVKFMFRYVEGDHELIHNEKESLEIVRISALTLDSIKLNGFPSDAMIQRLALYIKLLGDNCKKVKVIDTVGLETIPSQFEMAFKSFPLLEAIRGGKNMIKSKYTNHAARFHHFEEEMARSLEHGGANLKEVKWVGSQVPKNLPFLTPNLEILSVECPSSILSLSDSLSMWQKLKEFSFSKHEIYVDYNPPPVNLETYNAVVNHLNTMENLKKLSINLEESFPMQSLKLLEHKRSLTHLSFSFLKLDNEMMKTIGTLSNLKEIRINVGYFNSKSLESWTNLKQLESISIEQCSDLTDTVCEYLSQIHSLTDLRLAIRNIKDKGALMLVQLKKLEHLDLSSSLISNSCIEPIVKACKKLKSFKVGNCKNIHPENLKENLKSKIIL